MAKRYYWLKLPENWFQQKAIKKLRRIAGGDTYTIIYLKMLLAAIKQDGKLFFEGIEDSFHEELALEIDEDVDNVRIALSYLSAQHLVELVETDEYSLPEAKKLTGSESESAERMRRLRERKASLCDSHVTQSDVSVTQRLRLGDGEIEIEKEIEKEIELDNTFCPEPSSGPQQATAKRPTANNGVQGIDAAVVDGAQGIGTRAGMMVEKAAGPTPEVFIQLPLNTGEMYDVTVDYVDEKQALYPAIDVRQQLRTMRGWLDDNPKNRKTASGIKRFMNGWLAREQNRAPRDSKNQQAVQKGNRFHNFQQRRYDFGDLEKQLIQKQKSAADPQARAAGTGG